MTITLTRATWQQHLHAWQQSQLSKKTTAKNTTSNLSRFSVGKQTLRQNNTHPRATPPSAQVTPP
ncbi:MAG: hypothetical protein IPM78_12950 [Moraxellaceae bacterium]|nr:hypothetical protein [Moraxellaceae bacterium]